MTRDEVAKNPRRRRPSAARGPTVVVPGGRGRMTGDEVAKNSRRRRLREVRGQTEEAAELTARCPESLRCLIEKEEQQRREQHRTPKPDQSGVAARGHRIGEQAQRSRGDSGDPPD